MLFIKKFTFKLAGFGCAKQFSISEKKTGGRVAKAIGSN
jgi:hypothetical protein